MRRLVLLLTTLASNERFDSVIIIVLLSLLFTVAISCKLDYIMLVARLSINTRYMLNGTTLFGKVCFHCEI